MISRFIKPFITTAIAFTLLTACNGGRNSSYKLSPTPPQPTRSPTPTPTAPAYQSYFYVPNAYNYLSAQAVGSISMYKSDTGILYPLSPESAVLSNGYYSVAIAKSIGHAYLVNEFGNSDSCCESGTVSIYDINQKDGTLTLSSAESYVYTGYYPYAIAISESHAYVVNSKGNSLNSGESGTVSIYDIDPENGTLKLSEAESYIFTGYSPYAIAISESYAYVTNSFGESNDGKSVGTISMYSIDKDTGTLSKLSPSTVPSTGYFSTAIAINGSYAYVTNTFGESNVEAKSVGTVSIYNINGGGLLTLSPVESYVYTQYVPSY